MIEFIDKMQWIGWLLMLCGGALLLCTRHPKPVAPKCELPWYHADADPTDYPSAEERQKARDERDMKQFGYVMPRSREGRIQFVEYREKISRINRRIAAAHRRARKAQLFPNFKVRP